MAQDFSTTALLSSIRLRSMTNVNGDGGFTDAQLLGLSTEELQSYMTTLLLQVREEYLVSRSLVPVTAGIASYSLPSRAIGNRLRNVRYSEDGVSYRELPRVEPEHEGECTPWSYGFVFEDSSVRLTPVPTRGGYLEFTYPSRLPQLVPVAECAMVTSVAVSGANYVVSTALWSGQEFAPAVPGTFEFVSAASPFKCGVGVACTVTQPSLNLNTFTAPIASFRYAPVEGDYVALEGKSPTALIPPELHPLLAQRVVVRVLEGLGRYNEVGPAEQLCDKIRTQAVGLLTPRSEGNSRYAINPYAPGVGRRTRFRG